MSKLRLGGSALGGEGRPAEVLPLEYEIGRFSRDLCWPSAGASALVACCGRPRSAFRAAANKAYMEKIVTTKAPDQAVQITTDHMKLAYETFVAEATKIGDMYKDFFKSALPADDCCKD